MARIERTVFISYRRKDISWALAVYQYLTSQKYDVFFDFSSLSSGDFEQVIVSNIRARAHFVLILTPTALDRCNEPGDWLRREIETAIDEKRNIVPLFFDEFSFGMPSVSEKLTGKLSAIKRYNGLDIPSGYFLEAMERLSERYLNVPLDAVIQPISTEVRKVVKEEQIAANKALKQKREDIKELVKRAEEIPNRINARKSGETRAGHAEERIPMEQKSSVARKREGEVPKFFWTTLPGILTGSVAVLIATSVCVLALIAFENLIKISPTPTAINAIVTQTSPSNVSSASPEPLDIRRTMISPKDGMVMVYILAGEFTMGSNNDESDSAPAHTVYLDSFWIDQTEVTNDMYSLCVEANSCNPPAKETYLHDTGYKNHPVVYVSYEDATTYCTWADRYLPSEAEWEKSGRGSDQRIYPWGNDFACEKGNFDDEKLVDSDLVLGGENCDGYDKTSPAGSFKSGASPYGVLDMAGNVWEWVADWYDQDYYAVSPITNPLGPPSGDFRVLRGGSWANIESGEKVINRNKIPPDTRDNVIGFRCASK